MAKKNIYEESESEVVARRLSNEATKFLKRMGFTKDGQRPEEVSKESFIILSGHGNCGSGTSVRRNRRRFW